MFSTNVLYSVCGELIVDILPINLQCVQWTDLIPSKQIYSVCKADLDTLQTNLQCVRMAAPHWDLVLQIMNLHTRDRDLSPISVGINDVGGFFSALPKQTKNRGGVLKQ
jgi:hypothetical protein